MPRHWRVLSALTANRDISAALLAGRLQIGCVLGVPCLTLRMCRVAVPGGRTGTSRSTSLLVKYSRLRRSALGGRLGSKNQVYLAQRERVLDGMRKAGPSEK
jgi:hypothetical protein